MLVLDMVDRLKYQRLQDKNCVEVRIRLSDDDSGELPAAAEASGEICK
jgi:hypothetical protein